MTLLTHLDLIRRVPLFAALTPAQAALVAESVVKQRYRKGQWLLEQGQKSGYLAILLNGRARVVATDEKGREVILATLQAGDHVGEMSLIDNQPHSAGVRADVQTDALLLHRSAFVRCLPENNALAYAIMKGLVQRLRAANRKIESLALMDVYGRVARALLEAAQPLRPGVGLIRGRVSRQELARSIGASREMVSRVLKDLQERGLVEQTPEGDTLVHEAVVQA